MVVLAHMHVRVWLHKTSFREWWPQDTIFLLMLTKTGMAMAVAVVVAPMALSQFPSHSANFRLKTGPLYFV